MDRSEYSANILQASAAAQHIAQAMHAARTQRRAQRRTQTAPLAMRVLARALSMLLGY